MANVSVSVFWSPAASEKLPQCVCPFWKAQSGSEPCDWKVLPAPMVYVRTMLLAVSGPLFNTVTVYVMVGVLRCKDAGPVTVTPRSAPCTGATEAALEEELPVFAAAGCAFMPCGTHVPLAYVHSGAPRYKTREPGRDWPKESQNVAQFSALETGTFPIFAPSVES